MGRVSILFVMNDSAASPSPTSRADELFALHDQFEAAVRARREADLRCARLLARLDELDGWSLYGCACAGELGERHGLAASEARALLDLGRAVRTHPLLEQQVAEGKITVAAGAIVAEVLSRPNLQKDEDDWIEWAKTRTTKTLRMMVQRRKEEARNDGQPVVPVHAFVSRQAHDDLQRCRVVASRKEGRALSQGETLGVVADHYLDTYDEERVTPGERRCPPTALVNGRYVPRAVRREIYERQGQQCAVPMCEHSLFLEKAHLLAHASGGDREADNLVLLCSLHHHFLDTGVLHIVGTAAAPRFLDEKGRDFATRYDPGGTYNEGRAGRPADAEEEETDARLRGSGGPPCEPSPPCSPCSPSSPSPVYPPKIPVPSDFHEPADWLNYPDPPERGPGAPPHREIRPSAPKDNSAGSGAEFPSWADGPDYYS